MERYHPDFEQTLAWHCAPALAGIKPADLISWRTADPEEEQLPLRYDRLLAPRGIRVRELCRCGCGCLLLVYRPDRLSRWLEQPQVARLLPQVARLLAQAGYPVEEGTQALLRELAGRLAQQGDFPHEVGLFLGYPPADVEGFCRNGGRNFKLSGPWKVYDQVEEAKKRFHTFHRCRAALYRRVEEGKRLSQLFPVA